MDACQLLFGSPWQFDLDAQHAGKENVYRLEKNGSLHHFSLKSGSCPKVSKMDRHTFFTITHSEQEMGAATKESRVVHAQILKQVLTVGDKKKVVEHPTKVKAILEEFQGVMMEELMDGLPTMRDIQHHID